jgi:hypothetical chaperone protein
MSATFGIDFGTSNSAIAIARDREVRVLEWPLPDALAGGRTPRAQDTLPTVLFAPSYENELHIGHEAIAHYLFTGLEGRFIQSMKAFLPQSSFTGTMIRGRNYAIEDLVAIFLRKMIASAETMLEERVEGRIVLGRPARFSLDDAEDRLAESRLLRAAALAGLKDVRLLIEPVAAALAYEAQLAKDEIVLVADLGGGTSDFTLMRVGPSHQGKGDRKGSILASGGLLVAGDCFDGELVRARLFDALGFGSSYVAFTAPTPVPHWIFQKLLRWNHVSFLKNRKYLDFLKEVFETSDRPEQIGALIRLVEDDMGYLLFRAVERAKRAVHQAQRTWIADEENALPVKATLTKKQFEDATEGLVRDIRKTALGVLRSAGLDAESVDAVFMTGGTSLVPEIRTAFASMFGEAKLRSKSTFTSVVDGLARGADVARG